MSFNISLIAHELGMDPDQAKTLISAIRGHLGKKASTEIILSAIRGIETGRKTFRRISDIAGHILADEEFAAMRALAFELGFKTDAIQHFSRTSESIGYPMSYMELLESVREVHDRPFGILLPKDLRLQNAFWETQTRELKKWKLSVANVALIGADLKEGEAWSDGGRLGYLTYVFRKYSERLDTRKLGALSRRCWKEIHVNHRYAVPSRGKAEILADETLAKAMHLHSVKFMQEGANAPEVFLRFRFQKPSIAGIVKIHRDGKVKGFHEAVKIRGFRTLVDAIALSYYRDLVVPEIVVAPPHRNTIYRQKESSESRGRQATPHPRPLPRLHEIGEAPVYSIKEWYSAQECARHPVVGHTRWVSLDFTASPEKQRQALIQGILLKPGYTWVIEHERGSGNPHGLSLAGFDLTHHAVFAAPSRASLEIRICFRRKIK